MAPGYVMDPYREMEEINNRFDQLIRRLFGDAPNMAGALGTSALMLPVDVEETDDAYVIDVDLPNVDPTDVTIEIRGEELRIAGRYQERERTGVLRRQNRRAGEFEYLVELPAGIDPGRVEATYDAGVLTITVGKAPDAQPRRIEIRGGRGQRQSGQDDRGQSSARDSRRERDQGATRAQNATRAENASRRNGQGH